MKLSSNFGYDMEEQNKYEEYVMPFVLKYLEKTYYSKAVNTRNLHTEIDIECAGLTFDVKADTRMSETRNMFIETVSVFDQGIVKKKGWLYNSIDFILYVDVNNLKMLILPLRKLQSYEKYIMNFEEREIKQRNKTYVTKGRLVKLSVIFWWLCIDWISLNNLEVTK